MAHWIINTGFGVLIISERLLLMALVMAMCVALVWLVGKHEKKKKGRLRSNAKRPKVKNTPKL